VVLDRKAAKDEGIFSRIFDLVDRQQYLLDMPDAG
jgi:hypothetical protein